MNLKFEGNQVTSFFKLNQQYFFTVLLPMLKCFNLSVWLHYVKSC